MDVTPPPPQVDTCRNHDFTDIVVLHEHRGEPGEWREEWVGEVGNRRGRGRGRGRSVKRRQVVTRRWGSGVEAL